MGTFKDKNRKAGEGRIPLPGESHDRGCAALPGLRLASGQGREERRLARLAAETADGNRPASDQRVSRHHQFHYLRPRPAAARVRRRQSAWQPHRAPRQKWRDAAGARRQDLRARCSDVRHRRREGRGIARRHHGRRGDRLRRDDDRRADRIGAVGPAQRRANRPQARHQFRRALSFRARRRSRLHAAGARTRDADGDGILRRHSLGDRGRRRSDAEGSRHRFPADRIAKVDRE